jgi:methyltransferase (TIGR00027 family)
VHGVEKGKPSRTAVGVALRRAVHQLRDAPLVFADPIAVPLLGESFADRLRADASGRDSGFSIAFRAFLVARSRYAEDNLRTAVRAGVRQYVLLGAGLDTFAYRNPYPDLRVFEVDHPATQAWKRDLLARAKIAEPANLTFVGVDFEAQSLPEELLRAGFALEAPAYFAWLGVVPYLTLSAFRTTLSFIAARPEGSGVTMDYGQPRSALSVLERITRDALAARVRWSGEPFQLFFSVPEMANELRSFTHLEDLGSAEVNARYFAGRTDRLAMRGAAGRLVSAWR